MQHLFESRVPSDVPMFISRVSMVIIGASMKLTLGDILSRVEDKVFLVKS
jgi:hypothetical protein